MGILFCIFPDGRFVPRWTLGASAVLAGLAGTGVLLPDTWLDMQTWHQPVNLLVASVIFLAQAYRYRRVSNPSQRQQTRVVVFGLMLGIVTAYGLPVDAALSGTTLPVLVVGIVLATLVGLGLLGVPVSIGVAILRHGLFDIDLIINRAVIYSLLAAVLASVFISASTLTQHILEEAIGQRSDLVTIGAGLLVALAFQPMHRRIKIVVDRLLPARQMLTLVFTDIVGSTELLAQAGDARWREQLDNYRACVRHELKRFRGTEMHIAGDSFFATFIDPIHAVRCAMALAPALRALDLPSRFGIHWAACEMRGEEVSGLAVWAAARIMSTAGPDEIVVSDAVQGAVTQAGIPVEARGLYTLRGVPGQWRLHTVLANAI
jgi:class 3 adenylate cyclase